MIKSTPTDDGGLTVGASLVRQPAIYLDQAPLADLSKVGPRRKRFLDIFEHKGTLLFSGANAMDIAGPQDGTKRRIREFLDALGPYWIPLELNPYKVVRKEQGIEPSSGTPCVSESFLRNYYVSVRVANPTLARVVDLVHKKRENVLAKSDRIKNVVCQTVAVWRAEYNKDPLRLDQMLPPEPWDPARPTTFILRALERLVVREAKSYSWMPNDAVDFMHAAVAGACADLLVLDKQWKRRILEVARPRAYPWVFYPYELDQFLDVFEQCVVVSQ
jgi:hypothetical protein